MHLDLDFRRNKNDNRKNEVSSKPHRSVQLLLGD